MEVSGALRLKLPFYGSNGLRNFAKGLKIHSCRELLDQPVASAVSRGDLSASLRGKHGVSCCAFANAALRHPCRARSIFAPSMSASRFSSRALSSSECSRPTSNSAMRSTSERIWTAVPRACEPNRDRRSTPAALSSASCSRSLAMIVDLSTPQACIIPQRISTPESQAQQDTVPGQRTRHKILLKCRV